MAPLVRWALRAAVLAGLIVGGHEIIGVVTSWLDLTLLPHTEDMLHRAIVSGTAAYVVLMAVPFVPGAEIGFTLLTGMGGALAPLIYLATATSLMIAFLIGRFLPSTLLQKGLSGMGLKRAAATMQEAASMTDDDLQAKLRAMSSGKMGVLLRYRYVALALAVNMPGNVVLGGGGGIAMVAGLSRLFEPLPFLLTILLAVLPVPLLFYLGSL